MVKVKREPKGMGPFERCCICREPTPFWYTPKDVALCRACARTAKVKDLPDKAAWVTKERALRRGY
jgi:hypothetical protein